MSIHKYFLLGFCLSLQIVMASNDKPISSDQVFKIDPNPGETTPIGGVTGGTYTLTSNPTYYATHSSSKKIFSQKNITNIHQGAKEIIVTIDDGPTPGVTDKILDSLAKYQVQAVFFVVGNKAKNHPRLLERMQREGHIVANHTVTHPKLEGLSFFKRKKIIYNEIIGAHNLIKPYATNSPYFYFRAPYGSWDATSAKVINRVNLSRSYIGPLLWDIGGKMDTKNFSKAADWACWSQGVSVESCLTGYRNETLNRKGGVVLFHDLNMKSAKLIDGFLETFKARRDYRFISIDDVNLY